MSYVFISQDFERWLVSHPDKVIKSDPREDHAEYLAEISRDYQPPKTNYTAKEWLGLFPDMRVRCQQLLIEALEDKKDLEERIKFCLTILPKEPNLNMIWEGLLESTAGQRLEELSKKIRWYRMALYQQPAKPGAITDDDIERAKQFPLENLLTPPTNRHFKNQYLCPFHEEKTPSFHLYPQTNSYFCFGCQKGGDVISYVMDKNKMEFVEAVNFLISK